MGSELPERYKDAPKSVQEAYEYVQKFDPALREEGGKTMKELLAAGPSVDHGFAATAERIAKLGSNAMMTVPEDILGIGEMIGHTARATDQFANEEPQMTTDKETDETRPRDWWDVYDEVEKQYTDGANLSGQLGDQMDRFKFDVKPESMAEEAAQYVPLAIGGAQMVGGIGGLARKGVQWMRSR